MSRPLSEETPPNGEHDPADPEEIEDPGLAGGEHNGDKPEVAVWFRRFMATAVIGALIALVACGEPAQQLTPHACQVTKASPRPAECATVSPVAPSLSPSAHEALVEPSTVPTDIAPAITSKPKQAVKPPPVGSLPAASSTRINPPTPWNPPLLICPKPINGTNGEWISLSSPAICEPDHVYAFVAPPGWKPGDPVPPFKAVT